MDTHMGSTDTPMGSTDTPIHTQGNTYDGGLMAAFHDSLAVSHHTTRTS